VTDALTATASFVRRVVAPLYRAEAALLRMPNVFDMFTQAVFFACCARLMAPGQRVSSVYALALVHLVSLLLRRLPSASAAAAAAGRLAQPVSPHAPAVRHLARSATAVVFAWARLVATLSAIIAAALALHQQKPPMTLLAAAILYHVITDSTVVAAIGTLVSNLGCAELDSLETQWTAVVLGGASAAIPLALVPSLLLGGHFRLVFAAVYINAFLRIKMMRAPSGSWSQLKESLEGVSRFRRASSLELSALNDVCPVCLGVMRTARATPCNHLFHGDCLRRVAAIADDCPMCKRPLCSAG